MPGKQQQAAPWSVSSLRSHLGLDSTCPVSPRTGKPLAIHAASVSLPTTLWNRSCWGILKCLGDCGSCWTPTSF